MFWKTSFEKNIKKAEKYLKKGKLVKAKDHYLKGLAEDPDNIAIIYNLSEIYRLLNDSEKSKGYNEMLLRECNELLKLEKNETLLLLKVSALISLKQNDDLNETLDELLTVNPNNSAGLFEKAKYLELKHDHKNAIRHLDRILKNHPYDVETLLAKGRNLVEENEFEKAENCYNLVFKIDTKNKIAINLKSQMLKKKHNITLTGHDFMLKAIESFEREDFKASQDYFKKALDMNPEYDEIWFAQGELLIRTGHIGDAIASFKNAFKINPSSGGIVKHEEFFKMLYQMKRINTILGFENP